jgi:mono/diheme cytochrome c family protein
MSNSKSLAVILAAAVVSTFILAACGSANVETATPTGPTPAPTLVGDAVAGEAAFKKNGCSACHLTGIGPDLTGIGERAKTRTTQTAVDYIRQSITEPLVIIVPPYEPLMPTRFKDLPTEEVDNLIAYLFTLE